MLLPTITADAFDELLDPMAELWLEIARMLDDRVDADAAMGAARI